MSTTKASARKTQAKKTKKSAAKTPANTNATPGPTLVALHPPVNVRPRHFVGPRGAQEQAAVRAALASAHLRLPISVRAWNGSTAQLADGTLLIHNPSPDRAFTAHIACRHGAIHGWPITSLADLREARGLTHACERRHTANTPSDDGIELDWDKAITHGIKPTSRLGEGLTTAKKSAADTQPLSQQDIAEGLTARTAADTDQPKEHPQP